MNDDEPPGGAEFPGMWEKAVEALKDATVCSCGNSGEAVWICEACKSREKETDQA